ncbi:MAG: DUF2249 domain-containing protein [Bacteroidetes bacterium]|nr:DUF2249 domain-containing protein [Bacteroidota bacterium]
MKAINGNTKISSIIKEHPDALEAIISLSPKFNKLRNPLLRKLMASRTSIYMASKLGDCSMEDFSTKLEPLGFVFDKDVAVETYEKEKPKPAFMQNLDNDSILTLDVRPEIEKGKDPLNLIMKGIKQLKPGQVFRLVNSFEPIPLKQLLEKQGFESYAETIDNNQVDTFFYKKNEVELNEPVVARDAEGWVRALGHFEGKMEKVDVRQMEMPMPMLSILDALEKLKPDHALYVTHKRIPVFLLPELVERKFDYRIKEVADGEVYLLIFKA